MRHRFILPLAAGLFPALLLAGCGKGSVTAENASTQEVAQKMADADLKPLPGRWESSMKLESIDMEGVPPQVKDAMAKQMNVVRDISTCLTPEQVNKPDGSFFGGSAEGCTYKRFVMAGGKIDSEMTCGKDAGSAVMAMSGTYTPSAYDIKVSTTTEPQPGKKMAMKMAVTSRRTGECDGKETITAKDVKAMEEWSKKQQAK